MDRGVPVFGSALLQFDADGDAAFLELGRSRTVQRMAPHLTHMGVHDHGFNNVSTYGNLWRLAREGRIDASDWERRFYELALKVSGAVQARRWTTLPSGGFIHSFNGAHSLFVDTIRSLRALALGHLLGQRLIEEQDRSVSLLDRLVQHARATAQWSVYYGEGRDRYDVAGSRGRTAHESLFNVASGTYRGPSTQQGYSPFTHLDARAGLGDARLRRSRSSSSTRCREAAFAQAGERPAVAAMMLDAARATCDHYIDIAAADGVPYWDDGAPGLAQMRDWRDRARRIRSTTTSRWTVPPRQSPRRVCCGSAASCRRAARPPTPIATSRPGLRVLDTLFDEPYLSADPNHQGLLLHSVYHWPNRWDHVPPGSRIPRGESSQWGDYHAARGRRSTSSGSPRAGRTSPSSDRRARRRSSEREGFSRASGHDA